MYRIWNWNVGLEKVVFVLAESPGDAIEKFQKVSGSNLAVISVKESPAPVFPDELYYEMQNGHRFVISKVS
jgi:hypothetical protein